MFMALISLPSSWGPFFLCENTHLSEFSILPPRSPLPSARAISLEWLAKFAQQDYKVLFPPLFVLFASLKELYYQYAEVVHGNPSNRSFVPSSTWIRRVPKAYGGDHRRSNRSHGIHSEMEIKRPIQSYGRNSGTYGLERKKELVSEEKYT